MGHSRQTRALNFSLAVVLFAGLYTAIPEAEAGQKVNWKEIIGITLPLTHIGGIEGFFFPWTATDGSASIDLGNGKVKFDVRGLVLARSTPVAVAGTPGLITDVKGTLVCDGRMDVPSKFVDTKPVPLDNQGNAKFIGKVIVPAQCKNSDYLAFLIRLAKAKNPNLGDRWIAVGVIRTP